LETIDDTCPLLKKIQTKVAGEKQKHQQGEEDEV
jgi:4-hydroxy-3-methylbut-2-enyl diphosphate reductase IspH